HSQQAEEAGQRGDQALLYKRVLGLNLERLHSKEWQVRIDRPHLTANFIQHSGNAARMAKLECSVEKGFGQISLKERHVEHTSRHVPHAAVSRVSHDANDLNFTVVMIGDAPANRIPIPEALARQNLTDNRHPRCLLVILGTK